MDEVFTEFQGLLKERLDTGRPQCEDAVRYEFFLALIRSNVPHSDVLLEVDHPNPEIMGQRTKNKKEIDAVWVARDPASWVAAFEFKYHRKPPGGTNQPRPQKAGELFRDVFRLAAIPTNSCGQRYLVYVSDLEMVEYLNNHFDDLMKMPLNDARRIDPATLVLNRPSTFVRNLGIVTPTCDLRTVHSADQVHGHFLRIFQVSLP